MTHAEKIPTKNKKIDRHKVTYLEKLENKSLDKPKNA